MLMRSLFVLLLILASVGMLSAQKKSAKPDLKRGLVLYYPLASVEEANGGIPATVYGATPTGNRCGDPSYQFDGIDDYLDCGVPAGLNAPLPGLTISTWVHLKSAALPGLYLVAGRWAFDPKKDQFALFTNREGAVVFAVGDGKNMENGVTCKANLRMEQWYHVVATWNPNRELILYINGRFAAKAQQTGNGFNPRSDVSFKIGRQVTGESRPFKGNVDEVRVYGRTFSAEEVAALHKADNEVCNRIIIQGEVFNAKTREPVKGTTVIFENLEEDEEVLQVPTNETNAYEARLPIGTFYGFYARDERYLPITENLDARTLEPNMTFKRDLYVVPIEIGEIIRLNNLFFDFAKSSLRNESYPELNRLVGLFKRLPNLTVEIGGHTDNVGSDASNQKLSQARAESVRKYLISKGVQASRLTSAGYGEAKPVATNDTDEGRQLNRRVELRIVKK